MAQGAAQAVAKLQSGDRLLVTINGETRLATVGNRITVQSCHAKGERRGRAISGICE